MGAAGGDYQWYQAQYGRKNAKLVLDGAALSTASLIAAKSSKHTLYVQRIVVAYATHTDKTLSFIDDAAGATDVTLATITDEATALTSGDPYPNHVKVIDFGPAGLALTEGGGLVITGNAGGSGSTGVVTVEAYERLTGTRSYLDGASVQ